MEVWWIEEPVLEPLNGIERIRGDCDKLDRSAAIADPICAVGRRCNWQWKEAGQQVVVVVAGILMRLVEATLLSVVTSGSLHSKAYVDDGLESGSGPGLQMPYAFVYAPWSRMGRTGICCILRRRWKKEDRVKVDLWEFNAEDFLLQRPCWRQTVWLKRLSPELVLHTLILLQFEIRHMACRKGSVIWSLCCYKFVNERRARSTYCAVHRVGKVIRCAFTIPFKCNKFVLIQFIIFSFLDWPKIQLETPYKINVSNCLKNIPNLILETGSSTNN